MIFCETIILFSQAYLWPVSVWGSRWCRNDREASFEIKGALNGFEHALRSAWKLNGSIAARFLLVRL